MRINHNIQALNAYRHLSKNTGIVGKHLEKLSSGLRINRAGDDAAGLAISEKMRSQIRGLSMAERNSLDGISLLQTAEGALDTVHSILQRMRELSVQAANDTYSTEDRREIQKEINQFLDAINQVANNTEFNTKKLLNGDFENGAIIHIGPNSDQNLEITIERVDTTTLGDVAGGIFIESLRVIDVDTATNGGVLTQTGANDAISTFQKAIDHVSSLRAKLGAMQNRLEYTVNSLTQTQENLSAAESRIRDTDMALEMSNFIKNNVLNQAAQAMLAQANQLPQGILQLLK